MASATMKIHKVDASTFRDKFKKWADRTKGSVVTQVDRRGLDPKYFVDKDWLDAVIREMESIRATNEILADRELTAHLLQLADTIDDDVRSGKMHLNSMEDMFGK